MKTFIIGGGPAGLMAALKCAEKGEEVIILEKKSQCGKKLLLTGNGRCNLTALLPVPDFLNYVVNNGAFLKTALYHFPPAQMVEFINQCGVETIIEDKYRVFPKSGKAKDVLNALLNAATEKGVKIIYDIDVLSVNKPGESFFIKSNEREMTCDKVVITTGGRSYPQTGSDGKGYLLATGLGHTIVPIRASLCPIILNDAFIPKIEGLSLSDVTLCANFPGGKKILRGDLIFTGNGISGPLVLWMSAYINRYSDIKLILDLKPDLSLQQVDEMILRKFNDNQNKNVATIMSAFMPRAFMEIVLDLIKLSPTTIVHDVKKAQRLELAGAIKHFNLSYKCHANLDVAFVTSGGIDTREIDPRTMESKIVKNLFFAGEIIDADALSGGFSLQIAFATGRLVGG